MSDTGSPHIVNMSLGAQQGSHCPSRSSTPRGLFFLPRAQPSHAPLSSASLSSAFPSPGSLLALPSLPPLALLPPHPPPLAHPLNSLSLRAMMPDFGKWFSLKGTPWGWTKHQGPGRDTVGSGPTTIGGPGHHEDGRDPMRARWRGRREGWAVHLWNGLHF